MKISVGILLFWATGFLVTGSFARANENIGCFGVTDLLGPAAGFLMNPQNGPLNVSLLTKMNPMLSLENNGSEQVVKQVFGGMENANTFAYQNGRLSAASFQRKMAGKSGEILFGKYFTYDWPTGGCRPTRITVRSKPTLGDTSGVIFDREICEFLKKKGGFTPSRAESCLELNFHALASLQEFDAKLREKSGGKEQVVVTSAFSPEAFVPVRALAETGLISGVLASCADYFQKGPSLRPRETITDGPKGQETVRDSTGAD